MLERISPGLIRGALNGKGAAVPTVNGRAWQSENGGYTRISNDILEALITLQIHRNQYRVILWVARNSYGYGERETEPMSLSEIAKATGLSKSSVHHAIAELMAANVLWCRERRWGINKDTWTWVVDKPVHNSEQDA